MFDVQFVDKGYSSNNKSLYELSILVSQDGFSFLFYHPNTKNVALFKHKDFYAPTYDDLLSEVRKILISDRLLAEQYPKVKVAYRTTTQTIVPDEFVQDEHLKQFLVLQHPLHELDEIHYQSLPGNNAKAVFALPNYLANEMLEMHPNTTFYHQSIPLIHLAKEKAAQNKGNLILVNKSNRFFDVVLIRDNKLQLYNTFQFHTENDFVYFVMSVYKQLNLEKEKMHFFVSGLIRPEDEEYQLLERFVGKVSFDILPKDIANIKALKSKTMPSMFASLFGLTLCE
ncbi:MAG: DUF3822 family protein [Bacteroidota bacterium]